MQISESKKEFKKTKSSNNVIKNYNVSENNKENETQFDQNDNKNEEEEEEDAINISLAAMEHSLTPHVLSILEEIDKKYIK